MEYCFPIANMIECHKLKSSRYPIRVKSCLVGGGKIFSLCPSNSGFQHSASLSIGQRFHYTVAGHNPTQSCVCCQQQQVLGGSGESSLLFWSSRNMWCGKQCPLVFLLPSSLVLSGWFLDTSLSHCYSIFPFELRQAFTLKSVVSPGAFSCWEKYYAMPVVSNNERSLHIKNSAPFNLNGEEPSCIMVSCTSALK